MRRSGLLWLCGLFTCVESMTLGPNQLIFSFCCIYAQTRLLARNYCRRTKTVECHQNFSLNLISPCFCLMNRLNNFSALFHTNSSLLRINTDSTVYAKTKNYRRARYNQTKSALQSPHKARHCWAAPKKLTKQKEQSRRNYIYFILWWYFSSCFLSAREALVHSSN